MRVEIGIKYDDGICGVQVDSNASCPSGEHVDENIRVRLVKFVHPLLTIALLSVPVLERVNIGIDV